MPISHLSSLRDLKDNLNLLEHLSAPELITYWAAVHLVFYQKEEGHPLYLAMIRRVENDKDPWSGHYAFPGGGVNKDESYKAASIRETKEEIDLEVPLHSYLGEFYRMQVLLNGGASKLGISAHASFVTNVNKPILKPCPIEVDEAFWFPIHEFLASDSILEKEFQFSGRSKVLPCIDYRGHIIWGLSYMILREFLIQWESFDQIEKTNKIEGLLPQYPYRNK